MGALVRGGALLCSNSLLLKLELALDEIIDLLSDLSASSGILEDWRIGCGAGSRGGKPPCGP